MRVEVDSKCLKKKVGAVLLEERTGRIVSWGYGGTIPTRGGIVLGLVRLKEITGLDLGGMVVHVGAGVRWLDLLTYLEGKGYTFRNRARGQGRQTHS